MGMSGPLPTTYTEIKAYAELMGQELTPIEVATLVSMDRAFIEESYGLLQGANNG
jgi:hypothetical protein